VKEQTQVEERSEQDRRVQRLHLALGWSMVSVFVLLGGVLETLHGLKIGWYLDLANESRRLLLTLGHAHGVLIGLLNVALALSWPHRAPGSPRFERAMLGCFVAGSVLLPMGFLLGGLVVYGGDPNPLIVSSPIGGLLLVVASGGIAWRMIVARRA
jgi:vacuolar-type H+-ATPase subunit I/STV1